MQPERIIVRLRQPTRLDRYLTGQLAQVSRNRIQRHIERGDVLVEGRSVKPNHRLRGGEVLTLPEVVVRGLELASEPVAFDIVHEDADLLVVDKPSGLLVHPVGREFRRTLLNGVHHLLRSRGEGKGDIGIVHRLDRDTSGLIVVAKHREARRQLSQHVEARGMRRRYLGVVHGEPRSARGVIDLPIGRDPSRPTRMLAQSAETAAAWRDWTPPVSASGYSDPRQDLRPRAARTHYRLLRRLHRAALLRLELETGRTHQIRVHLQALGTPLWGDPIYGAPVTASPVAIGRLALHASKLEFTHPTTGVRLSFTAPLPAEVRALVQALAAG
ncbi:MAG TPA: RluA family pseudouridine synthase [Candidatus Krumholzibacteria bacterium]|nr:RluA family pseudouridine synthase [Candidatus Krumholzibacteria bacterium]